MIVHLRSLEDLDVHLRKEKTTGIVRLAPGDEKRFSEVMHETRSVSEAFPKFPVLLIRNVLENEEQEELAAKMIVDHGITDRLLALPVWWLVSRGRVVMVYKVSQKIMSEVLGIFSRKKDGAAATAPVVEWIQKAIASATRTSERPTSEPRPRQRPAPPPPGAKDKTPPGGVRRDPWAVLGVPRDSTLDVARKAYRELSARYHPDKVAHLGEREQAHAHHRMTEINGAWEAIKAQSK